jgi:hypothetical protein
MALSKSKTPSLSTSESAPSAWRDKLRSAWQQKCWKRNRAKLVYKSTGASVSADLDFFIRTVVAHRV